MRKLILVCTIILFGAATIAQAQVISATPPQEKAKKEGVAKDGQNIPTTKSMQTQSEMTEADAAKLKMEQEQQQKQPVHVAPGTKAGIHAPDLNDPDYNAKKAEWIKNYPEEYRNSQKHPAENKPKK